MTLTDLAHITAGKPMFSGLVLIRDGWSHDFPKDLGLLLRAL